MEIGQIILLIAGTLIVVVGMVALVVMMAAMAILWFNGFAPQFVD